MTEHQARKGTEEKRDAGDQSGMDRHRQVSYTGLHVFGSTLAAVPAETGGVA